MQGAGTQSNPYIITTPSELDSMRNNLSASYALGNDIDMSSWGNWTPISHYDNVTWINGFTGNFDGQGYKITNLTINKSTGMYLGLFGQFFYGTIQNVGLENVIVNGSNCRFGSALVGYTYQSTIKNCYVNGGSITAQDESGGLIGKALETDIQDSYANINVNLNTNYYGGGFLGTADSLTTVRNCYSNGFVDYTQSSPWDGISGFVGFVRNNTDVFFYDCYWDTQTSGQPSTAKISSPPSTLVTGLTGKTTAEMKTQSTYTGWDFTNTWAINNDYPTLRVFGVPIISKKETVTVDSFVNLIVTNGDKHVKSTKQIQSYSNAIQTAVQRNTATLRSVEGYLSQFDSYATMSSRTVRSSTANVTSLISPIGSYAHRESKTVRNLIAHIKPLESDISVLVPINVFTPNAYVTIVENSSRAFKMENMSNVSYVRNPSSVSEVANVSEPQVIVNPSYVEVMK
ncbi:hypothetical protein ACFRCQ_23660 [Cytobacillus firmus]|uniref:hypothetical protein n=1 Tax=Cytobacillus firmus TaxID=1399 RepID=UPI0036C1A8C2